MRNGVFTHLIDQNISSDGKRWPSEHGQTARVFIQADCVGGVAKIRRPFMKATEMPPVSADEVAAHDEQNRIATLKALALLESYGLNMEGLKQDL